MRRQQIIGGFTLAAALGLSLWGCPKEKPADTSAPPSSGPQTNAPSAGDTAGVKIVVIPKGTANSFWQTVNAGAQAAGKEEHADVKFDGPSKETDHAEQINMVQNYVTSGVKGIVLAATDSEALVRPVQDAIAKGVQVVTIDSGLSKDKDPSYCYIATDNVEGGKQAAIALAKEIGDKGTVGILGFLKGAASNDDRLKGFTDEMKAHHPNIKVAEPLYDDSDAAKALDAATTLVTANHDDLVGIFAANEPGGVGAGNYIKQAGKAGKIKLVAFDSSEDEIKDLQSGLIQALIVQDPYQMGYQGVKVVLKAIKGEKADKKFIDSGVKVVTKENFDTPEVQKLLFPTGKK
jgi:ribose transport system substrate-binding protein